MDRIEIKNMQFYGYHGVFEEEKKLGQRFHIDVVLETSLRKAGLSDNLDDAINYAEIYEDVKQMVTGPAHDLLESLGEKMAMVLLQKYNAAQRVHVTVRKPEAPIAGLFDYVAIHIERTREDLGV
jgi:dihydroneopterin aldolase